MTIPLKTIVLADDDPQFLSLLRAVTSELGYQCLGVAGNGAEAVELVRTQKPQVILLDFQMPVMDGLDALRQIVEFKTTAVVMLTASADPAVARQALDLGASGYIQKPCDNVQMMAILESAWHRFQSFTVLEEKAKALDAALELRKLTEKAKGILMEQQDFTEEEAHKWLQKMSQDQGVALKEVCRSVIQVRMVLGKKTAKSFPNRP